MSSKTLLTVEQFAQLPDEEGKRFELVEGELIEVSSAALPHNIVKDRVIRLLGAFAETSGMGRTASETDVRIGQGSVRCPDVSYWSAARWSQIVLAEVPVPIPPDLAVEVISPNDRTGDISEKVKQYLASGVGEVWLIYPEEQLVLVRCDAGTRAAASGQTLETPLLPGFSLAVADLFTGF